MRRALSLSASRWTRRASAPCTKRIAWPKRSWPKASIYFSKAIVALECSLETRLSQLEGKQKVSRAAQDVFKVYDLDGDGAITREEWPAAPRCSTPWTWTATAA